MPCLKVRVNLLSSIACLSHAVSVCTSLFHSLHSESMSSSSNKILNVYASRRFLLLFLFLFPVIARKKCVWGRGKVLVLTRDLCFWSDSATTVLLVNLPWFVSAFLAWTPILFNKQLYSNIPSTMSYLLSWSLGYQGLPGIPASMPTIHSKSTCWRPSICWCPATWPCSNLPMPEIPSGKMACLSPDPFSSSVCRYRAKYQLKFLHFICFWRNFLYRTWNRLYMAIWDSKLQDFHRGKFTSKNKHRRQSVS